MTLQVQVAESGPCSRTLSIQVPAENIRRHIDEIYASANKQVRMKGFRPGKVPRKVLEKQMGPQLLQDAKEQILNRYFNEACQSNEIVPVGRVEVQDYETLEIKSGEALEFTVKVDVRPVFEVGETKGLEVAATLTEVSDEDIENALKEIANQRRSIQTVDEPAEKGDFVKVDMTFVDEGGTEVHNQTGVQLNTSIPIAGTDQAAFEEALTGATKGQDIELGMTFPENFAKDEYRGKPGTAHLKIQEVLRVSAPPIDDELARSLDGEFDSLEALKGDLRTRIGEEKIRLGKQQQEEECIRQLMERIDFDLPESLIEEQQRASLSSFGQRLQQSGMPEEEIQKKLEESQGEARTDAQSRVKLFFLIEAVARQESLMVQQADFDREVQNIAASNQATPGQVREYLEKNNQVGELRLAILERKVRDFLRENASIVDRKA
jgi:trigger factor